MKSQSETAHLFNLFEFVICRSVSVQTLSLFVLYRYHYCYYCNYCIAWNLPTHVHNWGKLPDTILPVQKSNSHDYIVMEIPFTFPKTNELIGPIVRSFTSSDLMLPLFPFMEAINIYSLKIIHVFQKKAN